ncbi:heat shock protein DnaJ-like [Trichodesmium erythraeum IMS101]|uniref:Heat shock protein DnaJ-like n=1 Tax=Trichodesmium erythraeum (strain IMS101) TaxID=203124 RepID=Q114P6_TRIEI|nr:DnaJ domain-containing protein [Trichodesmium erythraeum GBRTRLIN201]
MEKEYNYYEVLRVSKDASAEQIKKAYHSLARQYHPDVNSGDINAAEKFKEINSVYEILSDPLKRSKYDKNVEEAQELYKRGVSKSQRGNYQGAILDYTKALEINPDWLEVLYNRAFASYKLQDYRNADIDYTKALFLDPYLVEVYYYRGLCRMKLKSIQAGMEDYTKALEINPNFAHVYYQRGLVYLKLQEHRLARLDFGKAAQLFAEQGDKINSQISLKAMRSLENFSVAKILEIFQKTFQDSWITVKTFIPNPIGGLLPAFVELELKRALNVAILLGIIFEVCFVIGISLILGRLGGDNHTGFLLLIIIGIIPFVNLTVTSGFARLIFKTNGSLTGDLFVAGTSLLPLGLLVLISGVLNNWIISLILCIFALCYTILIMYSGCQKIANVSEEKSALIVPIMLLVSGLPFSLIK